MEAMIAKSDDEFVTHNMKWGYTDLISIRFCRRKSASYYFICKYRKNVLGCVYKYVKNVWCIYVKFLIVLYVLVFTVQEVEYIENTTWSRGDMEFIFECSHKYRIFTCVQIPHFSVVEIIVKHCSLYNKASFLPAKDFIFLRIEVDILVIVSLPFSLGVPWYDLWFHTHIDRTRLK